jgi:hypothetical protein
MGNRQPPMVMLEKEMKELLDRAEYTVFQKVLR